MSLPTRDAQGYPISGIDVVPQKRSPPTRSAQLTSQLTTLLVEANRREEYMALKFGDLCRKCQTLRDTTPPGDTITICPDCSQDKVTLQSLRSELEKKEDEVLYWQDCYETALQHSLRL